ncbi:MAG: alpha-L-rhamnosidase [Bacteroidetes bacterium]|nr:alpha-L-rhamnosidase [Bacteroidota bacterium]
MRLTRTAGIFLLLSAFSAALSAQNPYYQQRLTAVDGLADRAVQLDDRTLFLDFTRATFGRLKVDVSRLAAGDTLVVRLGEKVMAERLDPAPGGNIRYSADTMVIQPGMGSHLWFPRKKNLRNTSGRAVLLPDTMGIVLPFRAVELISPKRLSEKDAVRRMYHHVFHDDASSFHSSDSLLNALWDFCKHTIKATTFMGVYIDGDRERIPYEADALINQLSHYAVDSVYDIARNTARYLLFSPAWPTEWHLQMHQILWYDHLYTGSTDLIRTHYDLLDLKTLRKMAGPDGLISTKKPPQDTVLLNAIHYRTFDNKAVLRDITDWPQNGNSRLAGPSYIGETDGFVFCDYNSVVNAFHYKSLLLMAEFARIAGKPKDVDMYQSLATRVRKAFRARFLDSASGLVRDGDTTRHSSLHANMFALAFGLVDPSEKSRILAFMQSRGMACSVYGSQFLLDALYDNEESAYAYSLITNRGDRSWYRMLKSGATMAVEAWDLIYKPNLDWNHAWGTAALNAITRKIIGMEPVEPGSKKIRIAPQLDGLDSLQARIPFLTGIAGFRFQRRSAGMEVEVSLPKGSSGIFRLPDGFIPKSIRINDKEKSFGGSRDIDLPTGCHLRMEG